MILLILLAALPAYADEVAPVAAPLATWWPILTTAGGGLVVATGVFWRLVATEKRLAEFREEVKARIDRTDSTIYGVGAKLEKHEENDREVYQEIRSILAEIKTSIAVLVARRERDRGEA